MAVNELIAEYSPEYCQLIEAAYGKNQMSEAGPAIVGAAFDGLELENKTILDIGSGLGAVAFYLAEQHHANVIGLEINPWLVNEATQRTPEHLKNKVQFKLYDDVSQLPFADHYFDYICSFGVIVHIKNKQNLFAECYRILKPQGNVVLIDWLTTTAGKWCDTLQQMCEMEDLTLIPVTKKEYIDVLTQTGFNHIKATDMTSLYATANHDIVKHLAAEQIQTLFNEKFSDKMRIDLAKGHELIATSMDNGELLIQQFIATK